MSRINAIRFKNLRSLKDTGFVNLKPITILVGKNSAGKSTFARTLPLLRQSAEEEKRAPILWYGRLVDFGDFTTALHRNNSDPEISFIFKLDIAETRKSPLYQNTLWFNAEDFQLRIGQKTEITISLNLCLDASNNSTYASSIELDIFNNKCILSFRDSKTLKEIRVNTLKWEIPDNHKCIINQKNITPEIRFLRQVTRKIDSEEKKIFIRANPLKSQLISSLQSRAHANTNLRKFHSMVDSLAIEDDQNFLLSIKRMAEAPPSFRTATRNLTTESQYFQNIKNLYFASSLPQLLELIDSELAEFFQGVRYIEPLRATAQRYYRRQELAVDEIDSKGGNVAMYVDSLHPSELSKLNDWLKEFFGFELLPKNDGGHIALGLKSEISNQFTNLADLGVGISQLLPIILQLWQAKNVNNRRIRNPRLLNRHSCVVIEQPELHLHPAYQAKIADVMVAAIENIEHADKTLSIISETHSPHLINRLGELIACGKLAKDDVQIVLFEDDSLGVDCTKVSTSVFDEAGILINWPFGFFEPS